MQISKDLSEFVRTALHQGQARPDIENQLAEAGWTPAEISAALEAWHMPSDAASAGPVPKPIRSTSATDAFFYALLFVSFGMVVGNLLTLAYGQLDFWLPDPGDTTAYRSLRWLRWSMAAILIFLPTFLLLHRADAKRCLASPARRRGTVRTWLNALALFVAMTTLLVDAVYLTYTWLDGQVTLRFFAKSLTIAALAGVTLAYFQRDKARLPRVVGQLAVWTLCGAGAALLVLSFWVIGGAAQGRTEQIDRWRLSDLQTLSRDVADCALVPKGRVPETLTPTDCAKNPARLTGFASEITYDRVSSSAFRLCVRLSDPERAYGQWPVDITGGLACQTTTLE